MRSYPNISIIIAVAGATLILSACNSSTATLSPKSLPTNSLPIVDSTATTVATRTPTNTTTVPTIEVTSASTPVIIVPTEAESAATMADIQATPVTLVTTQEVAGPQPATLKECATSGTLIVGSDATYQPFESLNETSGKIEGFDVDLLAAIGQKEDFKLDMHNALLDTIFTALSYGQYDVVISAAAITPDRQQVVNFSNPYFVAGQVIVIRKADIGNIKSIDDLARKIIGVQGSTTSDEIAKGIKNTKDVKQYSTALEAFQALAKGDLDVVINDNVSSLTILLNMPNLNLVTEDKPFTQEEYYGIAVRKDCTDLLKKINDGLAAVISEGTYASLYTKYFGEQPFDPFKKGNVGMAGIPTSAESGGLLKPLPTLLPPTARTN